MNDSTVTEEQIDAAVGLRIQGEFANALIQLQEMLERTRDPATRMLLLFHILSCSTQIEANDVTAEAIKELEKFPDPEMCRALANLIRANAEIDLGRPQNALMILEAILDAGYGDGEDSRVPRNQLYLFMGKALERLQRWTEALEWLERAHSLFPNAASCPDEDARRLFSWAETEILFNKVRSMSGLKRYEEAFELSQRAYEREKGDMKTLGMQYMANSLFNQGRVAEALKLYIEIQRLLPCRLVRADQLQEGINRCMKSLEKSNSQNKPS
jgi:tetratricopeptide (TPR) repeat protein